MTYPGREAEIVQRSTKSVNGAGQQHETGLITVPSERKTFLPIFHSARGKKRFNAKLVRCKIWTEEPENISKIRTGINLTNRDGGARI